MVLLPIQHEIPKIFIQSVIIYDHQSHPQIGQYIFYLIYCRYSLIYRYFIPSIGELGLHRFMKIILDNIGKNFNRQTVNQTWIS